MNLNKSTRHVIDVLDYSTLTPRQRYIVLRGARGGDGSTNEPDGVVATLERRRDDLLGEMRGITETPVRENRSVLTEDEQRRFDEIEVELRGLDTRLDDIASVIEAETRAAAQRERLTGLSHPATVRTEPMVYGRTMDESAHNPSTQFVRDLVSFHTTRGADTASLDRLRRHMTEVEVERRDLTRSDGAGGEWVPPIWLMDELIPMIRAARITADLVNNRPLPAGTDTINIPKVTGGTAVAAQTADLGGVQETDATTSSIAVPVLTAAGQQDLAIQLVEQSPMPLDTIIFQDLAADYASKLDGYVLNGTGLNGQPKGYLVETATGYTATTYSDASPTVKELWPQLVSTIAGVQTARLMPASAIVMHPRRWYWMLSAVDTTGRPLFVGAGQGPTNAPGTVAANQAEGGPAGTVLGLPVYLDANMPITLTSTYDAILVIRPSDAWLFEGPPRTKTSDQLLVGNLAVRLTFYRYFAFTAARYGTSIGRINGSGLTTPDYTTA